MSSKNILIKYLLILAGVILIVIILSYLLFEQKYQNKIYPGISLGNIDLGDLTKIEAKNLLNQKINQLNQNGIIFVYNKNNTALNAQNNQWRMTSVMPIIHSFDNDLAYQIIFFDVQQAVESAYSNSRDNDFWLNLRNKIETLIYKKQISIMHTIDEQEIKKILYENHKEFEMLAQDAELTASYSNQHKKIVFNVEHEKLGQFIDYPKALKEFKINLSKLNFSSIQLNVKTDYPKISKNDCLNIESKAQKIISSAPLVLMYKEKKWSISTEQIAQWLILKKNETNINVEINKIDITKFLEQKIISQVNKDPIDARFKMKDGRVVEFQASQDGLELDVKKTLYYIQHDFTINQKSNIQLTVNKIESDFSTENVNNIGIKEIIGTGHSNFAWSPSNRRHNIKTGADAVHGLLIKPDEEFSLVKTLGDINAEAGYLPELVIKGNKTIPEYGGGLCQIGTTIFRSAISSGLPITERRNHSYRVSYYEPAGFDATIYSPQPDVRFINDTNNFILIQARIDKDDLYFDFWGIKDGRIIEKTDPLVYNITKPGPTKIIETTDLPAGKKKCTERAHNGADAYFNYKVTYPDGAVKEEKFYSHYIPWQEVCLVGVEEEKQ